ncbi:hypothetical protein D3C80_1426480 [compost metagenome]
MAAATINSRARSIRPRPTPTRPSWPARVCRRERKKITPRKISSGDSQLRSKVSTRAISAVPTSAPSMIASAGASAIRPWPTKEVTSSAVALLLCTRAVTPMPAANASGRLLTLWLSTWRRCEPYTRRMPVRTMWVPQISRATADSRLSRVSIMHLPDSGRTRWGGQGWRRSRLGGQVSAGVVSWWMVEAHAFLPRPVVSFSRRMAATPACSSESPGLSGPLLGQPAQIAHL